MLAELICYKNNAAELDFDFESLFCGDITRLLRFIDVPTKNTHTQKQLLP